MPTLCRLARAVWVVLLLAVLLAWTARAQVSPQPTPSQPRPSQPRPSQPTPSQPTPLEQIDPFDRIAFITLDGQLAVVRRDGSGFVQLTRGPQRLQFPAWSPDGRRLAVIANTPDGAAVEVFEFGDAEVLTVELYRSREQTPFYLYWSPDGHTVSFLANHPTDGIGLHLGDVESGSSRLFTTGSPFYWQWSADGSKLFLHTGFAGPSSRLGFTDAVEDALAGNLAEPGFFQSPTISASGRYLAFGSVDRLGNGQVIVRTSPEAEAAGLEPVVRELPHDGLVAMGWSPTADLLALSSPPRPVRTFAGPIRLLYAESGLLETLTERVALAFFWSPNGRYLAYLSPAASRDPGVAEGVGPELVSLQQGPLLLELRVIEIATAEDRLLSSFVPTPVFVGQFLPFFDQYALSHSLWAPDSSALVLPMLDDRGRPRVTVIGLDGSHMPIAEGDTPFWNRR